MTAADLMRMLNILFSIVSLPPTLILFKQFVVENRKSNERNNLSRTLELLFLGFFIISILNSTVSLFGLFDVKGGHTLSLYRSTFISAIVSFVSWSLYFVSRKER